MKRPHASDDVRERALAAVDEGHPVADVAECFRNDPSTIRRWIRQRQRTGSGLSRPRSGRQRLIPVDRDETVRQLVAIHPDATLAMRCAWWQQEQGIAVSLSTMSRALRRLGITLKKRVWWPESRTPRHGVPGRR